jgi:hypothetical protein
LKVKPCPVTKCYNPFGAIESSKMCVRQSEQTDAALEAELCAYFVTSMGMDEARARQAARKWIEHLNRDQMAE